MPVNKPEFRTLSLAELDRSVEQFNGLVNANTDAAGTVDMLKLRQDVERTGDPLLLKHWTIVADSFQRSSVVGTSRDCSGNLQNVVRREDPTALNRAEVQTVLQAIIEAKQRFRTADKNRDGQLQRNEAEAFAFDNTLAARIGYEVVKHKRAPFEAEMEAWAKTIGECRHQATLRQQVEETIADKAVFHCATLDGAEAAAWGLREMLVKGARMHSYTVTDILEGAERSLLKNVPLFSTKRSKGHLSNREVKGFLGCANLRECVEEKRANVARLLAPMSYEDWVQGLDLPHHQHFTDPDVSRFDKTCR